MKYTWKAILMIILLMASACNRVEPPPIVDPPPIEQPPVDPPPTDPPPPPAVVTLKANQTTVEFGETIQFTVSTTKTGLKKIELFEDSTNLTSANNADTLQFDLTMQRVAKRRFTAKITDATNTVSSSAVLEITTKIIPVIQIAALTSNTCVLFKNGTVRCWGANTFGQLGLGNLTNIGDNEFVFTSPVIRLGFKAKQISVGVNFACALSEAGQVKCWGDSGDGKLGYGNTTVIGDNEHPDEIDFVDVAGTTKVTQISSGASHTCALLETGKVRCWGRNTDGQLGYGNTNNIGDNEVPSVAGDIDLGANTNVKQIIAGIRHTCALLTSNQTICWGNNEFGQLGYGNTNTINKPSTPNLIVDVAQIGLGSQHTCAITLEGKVRCWGKSFNGQLGYGDILVNGDTTDPNVKGFVNLGVVGAAKQIVSGDLFNCALLATGKVKCWGSNNSGQLGYGDTLTIGDDELPKTVGFVNVSADNIKVTQLAAGFLHTCALLETGDVSCWGFNGFGQLGFGNTLSVGTTPQELPAFMGTVQLFPQ